MPFEQKHVTQANTIQSTVFGGTYTAIEFVITKLFIIVSIFPLSMHPCVYGCKETHSSSRNNNKKDEERAKSI